MSELHVYISPYQEDMETSVRELIISGLVERWGFNDPSQNADLEDISRHYAEDELFVAICEDGIVGVGAIIEESPGVGRIVRMSVSKHYRGRGIGKAILRHLEETGIGRSYHQFVLETTTSWADAVAFYQSQGYEIQYRAGGDTHFAKQVAV